MSEITVTLAYHFKVDPAKMTPGLFSLPEQVSRTLAVGETVHPGKASSGEIPHDIQEVIDREVESLILKQGKTARKVDSTKAAQGEEKSEPAQEKGPQSSPASTNMNLF